MLNKYILIKILFPYLFFIMKKILPLVALSAASIIVLAWCESKVNTIESDVNTWVEVSNVKESLDLWELVSAIENNFPKSYTYSKYNNAENKVESEWSHVYTKSEKWFLTPEYSNIISREIKSSWIEDWMIYTLTDANLDDWSKVEVLYINDPATLNFVAANIQDTGYTINYQFSYDDINSLTNEDIESIAKVSFPKSATYSTYNFNTEVSDGWELSFENIEPTLANLTPAASNVTGAELNWSSIEDWMIYSLYNVTFDEGKTWTILYINNPETLEFVAATVDNWEESVNYQYVY